MSGDHENKDKKKVKAALARAESLSEEERSEIARKAASARWHSDLPKATHLGELKIGNKIIPCSVLEDGTRVLARDGVLKAIGRTGNPKSKRGDEEVFDVPIFLRAENLKPFITDDLVGSSKPILFQPLMGGSGGGGGTAFGYKAELLPAICEVFLDANEAGVLRQNQKHIAETCKILYRGFAKVGIIALVDEATGYQYDRARRALEQILEQFISKELLRWVKTFPDEYYQHIFRLKGWKMSEIPNRRPVIFGRITNDLVYERLAPKVLDELKRLTPRDQKGRLKHKYFQRLTDDVGHPKLRELLASEITLMRVFDDGEWGQFYKALNKALPKQTKLPLFDQVDGLEQEES
jgi:hypothetical protein